MAGPPCLCKVRRDKDGAPGVFETGKSYLAAGEQQSLP
jgi:hypothetical protein